MPILVAPQHIAAQARTVSSDKKLHELGDTQIAGSDAFVYVQAGSTLAAAAVVALTANVTSAGTGYTVPIAVPIGEFFWIRKTAALI